MIVVGLTGGIGAGKSTVSSMLEARGAVVVDADAITRRLQEPGQPVFDRIVERFGRQVLAPDGRLDRAAMARIVFGDTAALADLNAIVHPAVGTEIAARLETESATDHIVVLDIPLLVESGRTTAQAILVVDAPEEVAVRRLVELRGMSEEDAGARMANQASRAERVARADFVIDNGGSLEELERHVDRAWAWMQELRRAAEAPG